MKKILSVILAVALTASFAVSAMYSDWAVESIERAKELGIMQEPYDYTEPITREEFCELIYNYIQIVGEVEAAVGEPPFTDTDNEKIVALSRMGIINGKTERSFAPLDSLTREEAAVILCRMINKVHPLPVTEMFFIFDDVTEISEWAMDSVQVICNLGVMQGVGDNLFAPQESYTAGQAIATLVRVYDLQKPEEEIIGGADEPTKIIVTEEVEVDDFYLDEALKLTKKAGELAADEEFVAMYVASGDIQSDIADIGKVDYTEPAEMYYLSYHPEKVLAYYEALYAEAGEELSFDYDKLLQMNRLNLSYFANMINGRYGAETIAVTTVLANREGYIMPKDFERDFGIYLQYEGDYSALVTFSKIGEGVIEGYMLFVKNGDKADLMSVMGEMYDSLGEEALTIAKIK